MSEDNRAEQILRDGIMAELDTPHPQFNLLRRYLDELESLNLRTLRGVDETFTLLQLPMRIFPDDFDIYYSVTTPAQARTTIIRYAVFYRSQKMMAITLTHSRPPPDSGWTSNLFAKIQAVRNWPDADEQGQDTPAWRWSQRAINLISEHAPGITKTELLLLKTSFDWLE